MKPGGSLKRLAACLLLSSSLTSGACGFPTILSKKTPLAESLKNNEISSSWKDGTCNIRGNVLTYKDRDNNQKSFRLDTDEAPMERLHCTAKFTVAIHPEGASVAIGAEAVLNGYEMLGFIDGRFVPANSYSLGFSNIIDSDGGWVDEQIRGTELIVKSKKGREWAIDLFDPSTGWKIY